MTCELHKRQAIRRVEIVNVNIARRVHSTCEQVATVGEADLRALLNWDALERHDLTREDVTHVHLVL